MDEGLAVLRQGRDRRGIVGRGQMVLIGADPCAACHGAQQAWRQPREQVAEQVDVDRSRTSQHCGTQGRRQGDRTTLYTTSRPGV